MADPVKTPPFLRTANNYDTNFAGDASGLHCDDGTKTQQQFKEECDINTLIKRFNLGAEFPENFEMPMSVDIVDQVSDYHTAMNAVREAGEAFMGLPGDVRARFQNDPARLISFLEDDSNGEEARRLGLLKEQPAEVEPVKVRIFEPEGGKPGGAEGGVPGGGTVTT